VLDPFLDHGRHLLVGHLETAVATDHPNGIFRMRDRHTHRRRNREAHGSCTTRSDVSARSIVVQQLSGPHLVLTNVSYNAVVAALVHSLGQSSIDNSGRQHHVLVALEVLLTSL